MTVDEQAIHNILRHLETAWNAKDSANYAAPFAEEAIFIHIFGGQLDGRRAIEGAHKTIFDTIYKHSHASFGIRSVRFIRPDVAVALCQAHLEINEGSGTRGMDTLPTMIVVKEQGKWQIVAFQNTKVSEVPAAVQSAGQPAS